MEQSGPWTQRSQLRVSANDPPGFSGHSESRVINWGRFKEDLQVTSCAAGGSVIIKQQQQQQPAQCPWWMVTLASVDSASEWWLILKHNAATTFVAVGETIYTGGCRHLSQEGSTGDYYGMDSTFLQWSDSANIYIYIYMFICLFLKLSSWVFLLGLLASVVFAWLCLVACLLRIFLLLLVSISENVFFFAVSSTLTSQTSLCFNCFFPQ